MISTQVSYLSTVGEDTSNCVPYLRYVFLYQRFPADQRQGHKHHVKGRNHISQSPDIQNSVRGPFQGRQKCKKLEHNFTSKVAKSGKIPQRWGRTPLPPPSAPSLAQSILHWRVANMIKVKTGVTKQISLNTSRAPESEIDANYMNTIMRLQVRNTVSQKPEAL